MPAKRRWFAPANTPHHWRFLPGEVWETLIQTRSGASAPTGRPNTPVPESRTNRTILISPRSTQ